MTERNIGVPGALGEAIRRLGERIAPETVDHLWIFPPRVRGRSESGVIAAGCFLEGERRLLVTMAYQAEETGKGVTLVSTFHEEGEAPEGRLPQVIEGVVRRSAEEGGAPRAVHLQGDVNLFQDLIAAESGSGGGQGRTFLAPPERVPSGVGGR